VPEPYPVLQKSCCKRLSGAISLSKALPIPVAGVVLVDMGCEKYFRVRHADNGFAGGVRHIGVMQKKTGRLNLTAYPDGRFIGTWKKRDSALITDMITCM
ncbi:hypothetical protein C7N83_13370, partial [Neisseria iguanae]